MTSQLEWVAAAILVALLAILGICALIAQPRDDEDQ